MRGRLPTRSGRPDISPRDVGPSPTKAEAVRVVPYAGLYLNVYDGIFKPCDRAGASRAGYAMSGSGCGRVSPQVENDKSSVMHHVN